MLYFYLSLYLSLSLALSLSLSHAREPMTQLFHGGQHRFVFVFVVDGNMFIHTS